LTCDRFDTMQAACIGFADIIASSCLVDMYPSLHCEIPKNVEKAAREAARAVARLLPSLLGEDWAADECRDGKTIYSLREDEVQSLGGEEECPDSEHD